MRPLTVPDIILLHKKLIEQTGGSHGIRDAGLIESAVNRALATFDGKDLYTTVESKIAAVTYSLVSNHGFVDGNKRIGVTKTSTVTISLFSQQYYQVTIRLFIPLGVESLIVMFGLTSIIQNLFSLRQPYP